jgi:Tfp pilus assembly ATPase PilU
MRSGRRRPRSITPITTYEEKEEYARAFAQGHLKLLILRGRSGMGKSRVLEAAISHRAEWITGHVTAFELYRELWRHRNRPIVLDDVDGLFADKSTVRLLKALCQTEPVLQIARHSATSLLEDEAIPLRIRPATWSPS